MDNEEPKKVVSRGRALELLYGSSTAVDDHLRRSVVASSEKQLRILLRSREERRSLFNAISRGVSLKKLADRYYIEYNTFRQMLKREAGEELRAARAAFAERQMYKNLKTADKIEQGKLDANAGKTAADIRYKFVERTAPEEFGQKSSVDVNLRGAVGLHLEALKKLNSDEIEDAEYEVVDDYEKGEDQGDSLANHPLLQ